MPSVPLPVCFSSALQTQEMLCREKHRSFSAAFIFADWGLDCQGEYGKSERDVQRPSPTKSVRRGRRPRRPVPELFRYQFFLPRRRSNRSVWEALLLPPFTSGVRTEENSVSFFPANSLTCFGFFILNHHFLPEFVIVCTC